MAKEKKKLSKSAKIAAKLLRDSKLLADSKSASEKRMPIDSKSKTLHAKLNTANKMRPEKKRG
jgi:hypothetical protein